MRSRLLAGLVAALGVAGVAHAAIPGQVGPSQFTTANGRHLQPAGRLTTVGDFPVGAALTPDGRFAWVADGGHGHDDVQIVSVATGKVMQVLPMPGTGVGVGFSADGRRAYVSGEPRGNTKPPANGPTKADGGDAIHVFSVDPASGSATEEPPIQLPATTGGTAQQHNTLPVALVPPIPGPGASSGVGWPQGLAVTPDGKRVVVALEQADQVAIVDVASGKSRLVKVGAYPYGVATTSDGRRAYVTNEGAGTLSVLDLDTAAVTATIGVGGPMGDANAHPEGVLADPHRDRVYVAVASRDLVAVVDPTAGRVERYVSVGRSQGIGTQPIALALSPDGTTLYSADSGEDAVAAIALTDRPSSGPEVAPVHPIRVAVAPSVRAIERYRHGLRGHRRGARPRTRLVTACSGPSPRRARGFLVRALRARSRSAVARLRRALPKVRLCGPGFLAGARTGQVIGRIPTAAYPAAVAVTPGGGTLVWVSAKGLGAGPNPEYGSHFAASEQAPYGSYVLDKLLGRAGVLPRPSDQQAAAMTPAADAQVQPVDAQARPADSPLVGPDGGPSRRIKHVFYVVRENRTYDQILGTDPRGDGDPALELFDDNGAGTPAAGVTPNAHRLARMFPLLDHVYADSEVSVDGHIITSGADAIDYVQKALHSSYGGRGRIDEFGSYPITLPPKGFIFDQAARQGVSFQNYGELNAGVLPGADDGRSTYRQVQLNTNFAYPFLFGCSITPQTCNTDSGTIGPAGALSAATSRFDFYQLQFSQLLAAGQVPALTYLTLPNDHTNGVKRDYPTPRALVADNDLGLGQLVDMISHSAIWKDSAIFVVEDDSQDGADHVDAHRIPAFVISPWARHGAVVHDRYDQFSVLRTIELILGLKPLSLYDGLATPMYNAFTATPDPAPYTAVAPDQSLTERTRAAARGLGAQLPFDGLDQVPQELFDRVLWRSVYGPGSTPPPPGPGASPGERARAQDALAAYRDGRSVRAALRSGGPTAGTDP